jgi:hypothetical protein
LQNRLGQLLVFRLHYLGHKNSVLSLFVGAELDPRGHGLSHLKPGVNVEELFGVFRTSYFDLINGSDSGQIARVPSGGQLTPKVDHSNSHSVHSLPGDILIP